MSTKQATKKPKLSFCVPIKSAQDAVTAMNRTIKEVDAIFDPAQTKFETIKEIDNGKLKIQVTDGIMGVNPNFEKSDLKLYRADIPINKSADSFYKFLASQEGYSFITPNASPEDFNKAVKGPFDWPGHKNDPTDKLQIEYSYMQNVWPMSGRDFVILNALDSKSKSFYSYTVNAAEFTGIPGHIDYGVSTSKGPNGRIRAPMFTVFRVTKGENGKCILQVLLWMDIMGWFKKSIKDYIGIHFMDDLYKRSKNI